MGKGLGIRRKCKEGKERSTFQEKWLTLKNQGKGELTSKEPKVRSSETEKEDTIDGRKAPKCP